MFRNFDLKNSFWQDSLATEIVSGTYSCVYLTPIWGDYNQLLTTDSKRKTWKYDFTSAVFILYLALCLTMFV